jgi:hypothetical protein
MSSEEMRIELERFVNTGLREGWTGWPLKGQNGPADRLAGSWPAGPARIRLNGYACSPDMRSRFSALYWPC